MVYPIARGTAPLITLTATWLVASEQINAITAIAIGILVSGIWLVAVGRSKSLKLDRMSLFFALGTSCFIAAYTVVDGLGGRASGSASGYAALVFVLDAIFFFGAGLYMRGPGILMKVAPFWKSGVVGALLSATSYWIVIWAMTQAPIAAVAALRETSILFVILMSAKFLKEHMSWTRAIGGVLVVLGAIALRLSQVEQMAYVPLAISLSNRCRKHLFHGICQRGFQAQAGCKGLEIANVLGGIGK
jgi:drug/metabolite transporter (DMT)-like permease